MKFILIFSSLLCLLVSSHCAPIPAGKGKGRQASAPSPPQGSTSSQSQARPQTPTAHNDPAVPLPGRAGVYRDHTARVATLFYGDDKLPEHMGHLQRNQIEFPQNRDPMRLASLDEKKHNREEALHKIPSGGRYRNDLDDAVRDEKHIAMLFNKDHSTTTTVEMLPDKESIIEGHLAAELKATMKNHKMLGQLRPNPGWQALDPHQRIGHEAPAHYHPGWEGPPKQDNGGRKKKERERIQRKKKDRKPAPPGTNLRPGRVSAPGHVWRPNKGDVSHRGVPALVTNSDTRHSPRPQNWDHHMRQQHEAEAAKIAKEEARKAGEAASDWDHLTSEVNKMKKTVPPKDMEHFKQNLGKFNAAQPFRPISHGTRPAEEPGRLSHALGHAGHEASSLRHNLASSHTPHHDASPHTHHSNAPAGLVHGAAVHHDIPGQQSSSSGQTKPGTATRSSSKSNRSGAGKKGGRK